MKIVKNYLCMYFSCYHLTDKEFVRQHLQNSIQWHDKIGVLRAWLLIIISSISYLIPSCDLLLPVIYKHYKYFTKEPSFYTEFSRMELDSITGAPRDISIGLIKKIIWSFAGAQNEDKLEGL